MSVSEALIAVLGLVGVARVVRGTVIGEWFDASGSWSRGISICICRIPFRTESK